MTIDGARALARIEAQHALGPRFAGSPGHARAQALLAGWLGGADHLRQHEFVDTFFGAPVICRNLWARFDGDEPGRLLLGTHYDTRPWADRDPDPARRHDPVPGANDGGSGVALLAELAAELQARRRRRTVDLVYFDAEDWHEIDGKHVSMGSRRFVDDLPLDERPDAVIIVDMVGGRDLRLDLDVSARDHAPSFELLLTLMRLGRSLALPAFRLEDKDEPYKSIGCDHTAFVEAGIPAAILIDIDYPPWHTTADLPEACDADSLAQMGQLLDALVWRR